MKNNVLIIALITILAVGVIAIVIITSVLNGNRNSESSDSSASYTSETSDVSSETGSSTSNTSPDYITSENPGTSDTSETSNSSDEISSEENGSTNTGDMGLGESIVALANSLIGVPFEDNGDDPTGFDNSGFIYYVLRENGYITCPRGTEGQASMGASIDYEELHPGDLVFFSHEPGGNPGFGGIYIGDGKMIACLMPGTNVREVDITTNYYRSNFASGVAVS